MPMFLYSPAVQVMIETNHGLVDVSSDISAGQVVIKENGLHTMQISVINKRRKYDRVFAPNDRFVIYMKRIRKLLIMTGYLNATPYFSIFPRTIQLTGMCSIKSLLYHFWDPGSQAAVDLMTKLGGAAGTSNGVPGMTSIDGGLRDRSIALLNKVGGWDQSRIHIGAIPPTWLSKVSDLYNAIAPRLAINWGLLGGGALAGGTSPMSVISTVTLRSDAPQGAQLPSTFGKVTSYSGGWDVKPPSSDFYAQMRWGWQLPNGTAIPGVIPSVIKTWLAGRKLMVVNPSTNVAVIVEITGWGPPVGANADIGLSPSALQALGASGQCQVAWLDATVEGSTRLGKFDQTSANSNNPSVNQALHRAGEQPNTNPGNPLAIAVSPATGAAAAVQYCLAQVGKWYGWGSGRPIDGKDHANFDCSSLVANGWAAAGVPNVGGDTYTQWANVSLAAVAASNIQPGDLIYYEPGPRGPNHVTMAIGNGQMVEAAHTGTQIRVTAIYGGVMGYRRPLGAPASSGGGALGGAVQGPVASTPQSPLITAWDWFGQGPDPLSVLLSGPRALMNDESLLPTIDMVIKASMRSWCAAPNGDFIAWFPDYFGAYGTAGKMQIADVELQDFTVVWDDQNLITHQFTAGTHTPTAFSPTPGGPVGITEMFQTNGVVSVEFSEVMQALFNLGPNDISGFGDGAAILRRFGARPDYKAMGTIMGAVAEFWYALHLFQQNWASQFSASVPITFMPELYPGMLMQIPSVGFQAYVEQVTHSWGMQDGAGFHTDVAIIAPSAMDGSGLWGLSKGGTGAVI